MSEWSFNNTYPNSKGIHKILLGISSRNGVSYHACFACHSKGLYLKSHIMEVNVIGNLYCYTLQHMMDHHEIGETYLSVNNVLIYLEKVPVRVLCANDLLIKYPQLTGIKCKFIDKKEVGMLLGNDDEGVFIASRGGIYQDNAISYDIYDHIIKNLFNNECFCVVCDLKYECFPSVEVVITHLLRCVKFT